MPQFRTIEEFVQLLSERAVDCAERSSKASTGTFEHGVLFGSANAYQRVLDILRTSNLGIVHPPSEDKL